MPALHERWEDQNFTRIEVGNHTFRFHGLPDDAHEENGAYCRATVEAIRKVDALLAERERLKEDGRFTEKGIRKKLLQKAEELASTEIEEPGRVDENLARIESYRKKLANEIAQARHKLDAFEMPEPEDARSAQKDAETRKFLREMDAPDRRRFLLQATADGREDVVRAALDHSPELSGIDADFQRQLREKVVGQRHPETVQKIESRMKTLDHLERTQETVTEALRAVASQPVEVEEEGAAA